MYPTLNPYLTNPIIGLEIGKVRTILITPPSPPPYYGSHIHNRMFPKAIGPMMNKMDPYTDILLEWRSLLVIATVQYHMGMTMPTASVVNKSVD